MNIGIISSGNQSLALFSFLTKYNHKYLIVHDQTHFPFGSKDVSFILAILKKHIQFLKQEWAETIIVDPIYELLLLQDEEVKGDILPLFKAYLHDYVFRYSLVGKLWILTDVASSGLTQDLIEHYAKDYELTDYQRAIKKFHFPFSYREKSVSARDAGIPSLGVHNPYLIRTLKNDLRYFKDAYVDTIIPLHYHYFRMQRTIKGFFNFNRIRFHDFSVIESCFNGLALWKEDRYSVQIWTNQDSKFLVKEKELVWLLQRWKEIELSIIPLA